MTAAKRIAVTGATGFIGSHLTERLLGETEAEVLAVAASDKRLANLSGASRGYEFRQCDVMNAGRCMETMGEFRPEIVYHLIAHPDGQEGFDQMRRCLELNLLGLANMLEAASKAGVRLFVYGDSTKVYGGSTLAHGPAATLDPTGSYAVTKSAGWQLAKLAGSMTGMEVVSIRPEMTYGARQSFNLLVHAKQCLQEGRTIQLQGGSQTRDPLFIDDLVDALLAIPHHPESFGQAICLGGGKEYSIREICEELAFVMDCRPMIEANALQPRLTEIWRSYSDNSHAHRLLQWRPKTSLRDGLRMMIDGINRSLADADALARRWHASA